MYVCMYVYIYINVYVYQLGGCRGRYGRAVSVMTQVLLVAGSIPGAARRTGRPSTPHRNPARNRFGDRGVGKGTQPRWCQGTVWKNLSQLGGCSMCKEHPSSWHQGILFLERMSRGRRQAYHCRHCLTIDCE